MWEFLTYSYLIPQVTLIRVDIVAPATPRFKEDFYYGSDSFVG
jgi:hypothetical protein